MIALLIDKLSRQTLSFLFVLTFCATAVQASTSQTYTDTKSALMWQDTPQVTVSTYSWYDAKEACDILELEGYNDWWLPSEAELFTIVDTARPRGRKIASGIRHFVPKTYWTSSTYAWNAPYAWAIDFADGISHTQEKSHGYRVRCVRCTDFKKCLELYLDP